MQLNNLKVLYKAEYTVPEKGTREYRLFPTYSHAAEYFKAKNILGTIAEVTAEGIKVWRQTDGTVAIHT